MLDIVFTSLGNDRTSRRKVIKIDVKSKGTYLNQPIISGVSTTSTKTSAASARSC